MSKRELRPYLVLFAGVLIVSTASIMIKSAGDQGVPSLAIAAGRIGLATLVLTPLAWLRAGAELRAARPRERRIGVLAGIFLALHFAAWVSSLGYTSVASSTALVATNPIFVGLISALVLRERLARATIAGIAITVLGALLIALSDEQGGGSNALQGDILALVGAASGSAYLLLGQAARRGLSTLAYIWLAYSTAGVVLLLWALAAGVSLLGYPPVVYLIMLGLALGPQLLGHTAFNWALAHLSPTFVTIAILGEPVGSSLLAIVLRDEWPSPLQVAGALVVLAGIACATLAERRRGEP